MPPAVELGTSTPFHSDIFGTTYVFEEPWPHSLLVATVVLRFTHNVDWNSLLPRMPGARASTFRRLSARDSARIAILMNHTYAGTMDGYAYTLISFLRRVARKAGIRATSPYAISHPNEWPLPSPTDPSFRVGAHSVV